MFVSCNMQFVRLSSQLMNPTRLSAFLIASFLLAGAVLSANDAAPKRILFLGDSLTAGYGIDPQQAYPALVAEKIEEAGLPYEVVPSGLSGETSAGGLRRAAWVLQKPVDVLVVALGSNDGLRGIDLADTKKNLQGIIDLAREKYPDIQIVVAGMQMPPNLGEAYTREFRGLYRDLAQANQLPLIPFLLEGVGGDASLNIADGIHPNPEGHKIVARNVWRVLEPLLEEGES